jgi:hypothetical protein
VSVSCEEVRELLPEYAEPGPRPAGVVEVHVASCPRCRADLASYREMLSGLARFGELEEEPPAGYLERTLAIVPRATRTSLALDELRDMSGRVAAAARRRPAVSAVTGAAIGAAAIGLIAWRMGRRAVRDVGRSPELATS